MSVLKLASVPNARLRNPLPMRPLVDFGEAFVHRSGSAK